MSAPHRCADVTRRLGLAAAGTAPVTRQWLLLEHPGPWSVDALEGSGIAPALRHAVQNAARTSGTRILLIRRPDRTERTRPRRWILTGPGRTARSGAWRSDSDLAELPTLLAAPAAAVDDDPDVTGPGGDPLVLVCTHGVRDTCCAIRGRPVAAALAERWPDLVWECSHLGGHRFAPNVLLLPDGFYYAAGDVASAIAAVQGHLAGEVNGALLRGPAPLEPAAQAAAVEIFRRLGPLRASDVRLVGVVDDTGSEHRDVLARFDLRGTGRVEVRIQVGERPPEWLSCDAAGPAVSATYQVRRFDVGAGRQ